MRPLALALRRPSIVRLGARCLSSAVSRSRSSGGSVSSAHGTSWLSGPGCGKDGSSSSRSNGGASQSAAGDRAAAWTAFKQSRDVSGASAHLAQLQPLQNAAEYTSAINVYGRLQAWESALDLLKSMPSAPSNVKPNVFSYSAAITACVRAGQCSAAFELHAAMRAANVKPNIVTYTALHGALSHATASAPNYEQIVRLWRSMLADGVEPSIRCAPLPAMHPIAAPLLPMPQSLVATTGVPLQATWGWRVTSADVRAACARRVRGALPPPPPPCSFTACMAPR